jgi:hypothetical protein
MLAAFFDACRLAILGVPAKSRVYEFRTVEHRERPLSIYHDQAFSGRSPHLLQTGSFKPREVSVS